MMEKQAAAPRKQGGYLEALLISAPVAILATNAEGIITFANKEACKLVEREMHELVGESIVTAYGNLEEARETNRQLYRHGGIIRDHEAKMKTKSGRTVPVRISASHLKDGQGNYIGAVGYFETYRPWPAAESRLKARLEELEATLEKCRDLGSPVFEIYPGISAMVITGPLDSERFGHIADNLMKQVKKTKSRVAIIDLSSAEVNDAVANQLVKTIRTLHLMGTQSVLAGCQTSIALAMEPLISEISSVKSFCETQVALDAALNLVGFEICKKGQR
ncbi:MAG: PAS domain-containing protein [Dehalococcoidales bacterium]|nr:PAS domain-containing protein [Dehalococcoidales bacterium]